MYSSVTHKYPVVFLLLLLAGPVFAQPAYAPETPEAPSATPERAHVVARLSAEVGLGVVASLGMGLVGALSGALVGVATCEESSGGIGSGLCSLGAAAIGAGTGVAVGLPLGVWWAGKMGGGNGSFLGAVGGVGASLALGGTAYLLNQESVATGLLLAMPLFAAVGYELTDSAPSPQGGVTPALGLTAGGASFGLQGRF